MHCKSRTRFRAALMAGSLGCSLCCSMAAGAAPLLRCHVQDGDNAKEIQAAPGTDPYRVQAERLGHFRFKAVVIGAPDRIDYIKLYTYVETGTEAAPGARLLQEAKYLQPQPRRDGASLTGTVYLYEPRLGREFSYDCALREEGA